MKVNDFKGFLLSALVITSISALAMLLLSSSPVHAALISHAPIYINGNGNFTVANGVNGGGSGTENDPYIIENWNINASIANGIDIRTTTAYFVVRNCYVHDGRDNLKHGIFFYNVINGKIDNVTSENNGEGIEFNHSNGDSVISSTISYSDNVNVNIYCSDNNLISGCSISNTYVGISLENSLNDNISNCAIQNHSDVGIYVVHNSHNNLIYHNNFVNNSTQANDSTTNFWDNDYPSGGNYWSDYTGADNYHGENQDIPGSDGIGDAPYIISGGTNQDSYPLMSQWAPIEVSISPDNQSGLPGETLIYIVDIKNNENVDVDYYAVVTDNLGWKPAFGFKSIIIAPLDEVWAILKVTIPENAIGGTDDNITVTMVSIDNMVSNSASCVSHVTIVRGVAVLITPSENSGPSGATLDYVINVKNTGNVEDNYGLTATDDAGWGLEILPSSLIVPPRGQENAVLSVTIPENAAPNILDNITVTATSQENENVNAENSCTTLSLAASELNLFGGWNLVCFSLTSESTTPNNVFAGLTYITDYVIYYWQAPAGPYTLVGPNDVLKDNTGYWVWIYQDKTVKTSGIPPDNRNIHLVPGWNLVGFPIDNASTTPSNKFAGLIYLTNYTIYSWTAPSGPYVLQGTSTAFKDNTGYWVWIDRTWTVTVP